MRLSFFGIVIGLALLLAAPQWAMPAIQIDLYGTPGSQVSSVKLSVDEAALAQRFGDGRLRDALRPQTFGTAFAADRAPEVLRVVSVATIGPEHVRIRVAARDKEVAVAIADEIAAGIQLPGFTERLMLRSETTGGRMVLVAQLLGYALLAAVLLRAGLLLARRVIGRRPMAPAASI